ncbi:MAG: 16S rRNA (guanine(966)-N(2))-methyltransferase RsmD [Alphaproteobacteria bacterium]|nr:16S rRNA (guanine(966)-N(2))-methyltransferase RsmD [Alphaproteobacteria bacterium]
MRIVAGSLKGRRLLVPTGRQVRPSADRLRESLFNVLIHGALGSAFQGARVLDAFAGTGALGFEALSRGAAHATFIEQDAAAARLIAGNAALLGLADACTILTADATRPPPAPEPCALVLLDPPYGSGLAAPALVALAAAGWIAASAVVTVEIAAAEPFAPPAPFVVTDMRRWGAGRVVFLARG